MNNQFKSLFKITDEIVLGKEQEFKLALAAFFSNGHLLIEDVPGVGKTTFAKLLAKSLGLELSRIQFTSDLMPADIVGMQIYNQSTHQIDFFPGPIFSQILLADELNRGNSKTQSALLEAMEEYQVTVDRKSYPLSKNFFVIATQNAREQIGTNPLPESQIDRFMMKIKLGYPKHEDEKKLILKDNRDQQIKSLIPFFTKEQIESIISEINDIHISPAIIDYIMNLIQLTRTNQNFLPLSPRCGVDIVKAVKAFAYIEGENKVVPDYVQQILPSLVGHRLNPDRQANIEQETHLVHKLIQMVPLN